MCGLVPLLTVCLVALPPGGHRLWSQSRSPLFHYFFHYYQNISHLLIFTLIIAPKMTWWTMVKLYLYFDFDLNWTFPDCSSSLTSLMALKWCTKLDVVYKRCAIVFQGHPSNFKVTQVKKSTNFDPKWAFLDYNSSLNSLMDVKWCTKPWCSIEEVPCCFFPVHPSNFKVTRAEKSMIWIQFE